MTDLMGMSRQDKGVVKSTGSEQRTGSAAQLKGIDLTSLNL